MTKTAENLMNVFDPELAAYLAKFNQYTSAIASMSTEDIQNEIKENDKILKLIATRQQALTNHLRKTKDRSLLPALDKTYPVVTTPTEDKTAIKAQRKLSKENPFHLNKTKAALYETLMKGQRKLGIPEYEADIKIRAMVEKIK